MSKQPGQPATKRESTKSPAATAHTPTPPRPKTTRMTYSKREGRYIAKLLPDPPQPVPPPEPKPPRLNPFDPPAATIAQWANTAINHFVAIRATGSTPAAGGASWPVDPLPTSAEAIAWVIQQAEAWWPNARSFDLIGGDLQYKTADASDDSEGMADGMNRLRNAVLITTFTVIDRGTVSPPAPAAEPAIPAPPAST